MIKKLGFQLYFYFSSQPLTLIRWGLVGLALLATALHPQPVWADLSGGGSGGS